MVIAKSKVKELYDLRHRYSKAIGSALLKEDGTLNPQFWEEANELSEEWSRVRNEGYDNKDLATVKAWELIDSFFQEPFETLCQVLTILEVEVAS